MRKILAAIICICAFSNGYAQQQYPYFNDIRAFKKQDSIHAPAGNEILFIGSSSFTYWQDVNNYFPGHRIINRGFGGSNLLDVIHYADDVIFAYRPKQIVIYCGENDLASDTVKAPVLLKRFRTLYTMIRDKMPDVPVTYISIKPSPSRARLLPEMRKSNKAIQQFLAKQRNTSFVDVFSKMLKADGSIDTAIFREDQLHMKPAGYRIWQKAIAPHLADQAITTMKVATFNLRLNIAYDSANAWPHRKEMVKDLIRYHGFDIFGVQEALIDQMHDLDAMGTYAHVGVGRNDGKEGGEFSAIFYNKEKYELVKSGNFWLSPTPEIPSKGWDAAYIRICTWAHLTEKTTGKEFYFFNTHFDNEGVQARENAARMILEKIQQLTGNRVPVVITGDFNSSPETSAYGAIIKQFRDAKLVSKTPPYGPDSTFQDFKYHNWTKVVREGRIDFVFVNDNIEVLNYAVLTDSRDLRFPSDHFPVVCTIRF
ncbi:endonuclease/exonuclease/phosphatase family metal-dependent hydrolase/lysophospholipase L1-like esterase [Chitinophaga terrae (ex Kim and Jung 2007)]|uniref:endonuclease/exonuclease/phosphatase family protein n=1 Tax=Chitinophaga terrae (ex Kim and Jung 2007) TaxID=408074 RepID=UPI0027896087|nr:endonuclease/exonuclease/phosphatase family protein [Chitinophaga terrae (ex Kim and Jung 2007)]MDQ0109009.1 endonuclease/exonuclease/phosphatase family metal-dependent hydrolase/lysophospholipase L1-like esterase [Chitinophaga terrae (ex Kim and Jung 2007)]